MHIIIAAALIITWFFCRHQPDGRNNPFGKSWRPLYQISAGLVYILCKPIEKSRYVTRLKDRLSIMYPNKNANDLVRQYLCYKGSLMIAVLGAAVTISFVVVQNEKKQQADVDRLKKDSYWGNERQETLLMAAEGIEDAEEVTITIPEQKYKREEIPKILQKMASSLEKTILKDNESLDCVTTDLNLVSEIPNTQIEVQWEMDTDAYLQYDGTLIPDAVTEDGAVVNLTARLIYEEESCNHSFAVHLLKPELSEEEQLKKDIIKEIEARNVSEPAAAELVLPAEVQGNKISFTYPANAYGYKIFAGLLICAVLIFFMQDENLSKDLEKRKKQMLADYSEVVSKLTLLLGAGITIRSALEKIAGDYNKKLSSGKCKQRYAYDEILYICREMQGGISERVGIDLLGRRCQIPCYMKLCSLLLQNLKKGSKGMAEALSYEVGQAFDDRKNLAKQLGEEAGTKLLFPMILMLAVVMAVLVIPAFLSF